MPSDHYRTSSKFNGNITARQAMPSDHYCTSSKFNGNITARQANITGTLPHVKQMPREHYRTPGKCHGNITVHQANATGTIPRIKQMPCTLPYNNRMAQYHYNDVTWTSWRPRSPKKRLFLQQFVQTHNKDIPKPPPPLPCDGNPRPPESFEEKKVFKKTHLKKG